MLLGTRVLRGPDWDQNGADGGEGHLGTVVGVRAEERTAEVVWDNGQVTTCRVGKEGKHDLRILDNAQAGVYFHHFKCDGCQKRLFGLRWECTACFNFDLCTVCYILDVHDLTHEFNRHIAMGTERVRVGARQGSRRAGVVGIFPGARVTRGRDWNSGDVDGGAGGVGTVVEVMSPESGSARNAVRVSWDSGQSLQHRLGLHGKVDLVLNRASPATPRVYLDHLPVLDLEKVIRGIDGVEIKVGSTVQVEIDEDRLKVIQKGRGGWSVGLAKCVGKTGVVMAASAKGDVDVDIDGKKWRINPVALKKVEPVQIRVGDKVRILDDLDKVRELQEGHGGWNDQMRSCLGKVGKVKRIDGDGDYRVSFGTTHWSFNPLCCRPDPHGEMEHTGAEAPDPHGDLCHYLERLIGRVGGRQPGDTAARQKQTPTSAEEARSQSAVKLGKAIVTGDVSKVAAMLDREPGLIRQVISSGTPLHWAADAGEAGVASLLLDRGADTNQADRNGDTPLILAVNKNQRRVAELLLRSGAEVSRANSKGRTALHEAATRGRFELCRLLVDHRASVNRRDKEGNTPLFSAMATQDAADVMEILLSSPDVDVYARNGKDFTILHDATYRYRPRCVGVILAQEPGLVRELADEERWTALHIAAVNDRSDIIRLLLQAGADVDKRNTQGHRPLHLACDEVHINSTMALVEGGADVNAQDDVLWTPLHRAICGDTSISRDEECRLRVAKYLIGKGARADLPSLFGKTPLEVAPTSLRAKIEAFLQGLRSQANRKAQAAQLKPTSVMSSSSPGHQRLEGESKNVSSNEMRNHMPVPRTAETVNPASACRTCSQKEVDVIFLPCVHKLLCQGCASSVSVCPQCQKKVKQKIDLRGNVI